MWGAFLEIPLAQRRCKDECRPMANATTAAGERSLSKVGSWMPAFGDALLLLVNPPNLAIASSATT